MAKAKLNTVTKEWIDGKAEKHNDVNMSSRNNSDPKVRQTIYISKETNKLLWYNRAETGEPLSQLIERLVQQHLKKKD